MGFGANLAFLFIIAPLTVILLLCWAITGKAWIGRLLAAGWILIFAFVLLVFVANWLTSKKVLDEEDYYGSYVINRDYFKGPQADWQYNHFRFEITDQDSIYFHVTEKEKILKTYRGIISTKTPYESARLKIYMEKPSHHIVEGWPTTYRSTWNFHLVFYSPKFNNVFFEKGKWKPID